MNFNCTYNISNRLFSEYASSSNTQKISDELLNYDWIPR